MQDKSDPSIGFFHRDTSTAALPPAVFHCRILEGVREIQNCFSFFFLSKENKIYKIIIIILISIFSVHYIFYHFILVFIVLYFSITFVIFLMDKFI